MSPDRNGNALRMADQGTIDVIRDALADSGAVELDRVELVLDDGAVVLQGAVPTQEQATLAAMLAERHAGEVRNHLRVDRHLREDETHSAVPSGAQDPDDGLVTDVSEALDENQPWDPPTEPHTGLTANEQRDGGAGRR